MIGAFSNVMPTLGGGLEEYEEDRDGVVHIGNLSVFIHIYIYIYTYTYIHV
jgi:hypothetical protein